MLPSSSSSLSSNDPRRLCPICAGISTGFYFGVPSCRACASFFRRSALERRQYICRRDGNCLLQKDGMRNSCRACRLKNCISAGMSLVKHDYPVVLPPTSFGGKQPIQSGKGEYGHISSSENGDKTVTIHQDKLHLSLQVDLKYPNAAKVLQSLRNIESGTKAIVSVLDIAEGSGAGFLISDQTPHLITYDKLMQIDRGCVTLHLALIREHFAEFDTVLSTESKVTLLRTISLQLHFFRVADLTLRAFPNQTNLERMVLHWGCMIEKASMEHFFSMVIGNVQERIRLCEPIWDLWKSFVLDRFRPMALSQLEISTLIGIMFWNSVERVLPNSAEPSLHLNALYVELHAMVAQRCCSSGGRGGAAEIAIRLGQLHALLQEITVLGWQMEETITMFKLFLPPLHHCWDHLDQFLGVREEEESSERILEVEKPKEEE